MRLNKFEKHLGYVQTMLIVVEMFKQGIIKKDDFIKIEEFLGEKYGLEKNSI